MTDDEFAKALDDLVNEAIAAGVDKGFISAELAGIVEGLDT